MELDVNCLNCGSVSVVAKWSRGAARSQSVLQNGLRKRRCHDFGSFNTL